MRNSINPKRYQLLNTHPAQSGPVLYWMSRDQRIYDNWALSFAQERANALKQPLVVVFCLQKKFLTATPRHFLFMLEGLQQVQKSLSSLNIPFYLISGSPENELPAFINQLHAGLLITDMSPLRIGKEWRKSVAEAITIQCIEVDAHNIIPVWVTSQKQEFAAHTIRPKIYSLLPEYLEEIPTIQKQHTSWTFSVPTIDWHSNTSSLSDKHPITWIKPGETYALQAVETFLFTTLDAYGSRNDPTQHAQSDISPYVHFGHIASKTIVDTLLNTHQKHIHQIIERQKNGAQGESVEKAFLEELIVRKELADNFCYYNSAYDSFEGFPSWAKTSLHDHRNDPRPYLYTYDQLEQASTHDPLWNAAQQEMVKKGKMHGYMRMYWAKKILEWTTSPEQALEFAIRLNDTYELDGRDPNGYAGIAWSIGGVHDRPWFERPIFGKIRYMSYNGAKSKFKIQTYIDQWS